MGSSSASLNETSPRLNTLKASSRRVALSVSCAQGGRVVLRHEDDSTYRQL